MDAEILSVEETGPLPVPESRWKRVTYALIVVVLPVACFFLIGGLHPEWQSGELSDYAALMLIPETSKFFFPFMVYAVVCMLLLLVAPRYFAPRFVVRLGIYTGCLLALQYTVLVAGTDFAFISFISGGFLIAGEWISGKIKSRKIRNGFFLLFTIAGIALALASQVPIEEIPILVFMVILIASPLLCLTVAAVTAIKLIKIYERKNLKIWQATGLAAWLISYLFAWRFSVLQAIEIYDSLPTYPPDCYIATASARGHNHIVRSWPVATSGGKIWVTRQLQVLKCAELALMTLTPRFHRILRTVYDVVGVALARRLTNPFLADLAYLTLKPFEWAAALALKVFVPEIDEYAKRLYSTSK
jgi:hypothetical protein